MYMYCVIINQKTTHNRITIIEVLSPSSVVVEHSSTCSLSPEGSPGRVVASSELQHQQCQASSPGSVYPWNCVYPLPTSSSATEHKQCLLGADSGDYTGGNTGDDSGYGHGYVPYHPAMEALDRK